MPLSAILFDLDGTLLDTLADLADAANRTLDAAGLPTHPQDAYRRFIGDGSRLLITRALPEIRRDTSTVDAFLERFKADYGANWHTATHPYPGIEARRAIAPSNPIPPPPWPRPIICRWHRPNASCSGTAGSICRPPGRRACCPWASPGASGRWRNCWRRGPRTLFTTPWKSSRGSKGAAAHDPKAPRPAGR